MGITLVTISHRPALFKYHAYLLKIGLDKNNDGYTIESISTAQSFLQSVDAEIQAIRTRLDGVDVLKARLDAIKRELEVGGDGKQVSAGVKRTVI
jgi:ATP-binding cassette subfamily D (ALD) long-chain fatty acid import protein